MKNSKVILRKTWLDEKLILFFVSEKQDTLHINSKKIPDVYNSIN